MKRVKISLAVLALAMGIMFSAFTTKKSVNAQQLFQDAWYRFDIESNPLGDPQDPANYDQTSFTASDPQAVNACDPIVETTCAGKFEVGTGGVPVNTPSAVLDGQFIP